MLTYDTYPTHAEFVEQSERLLDAMGGRDEAEARFLAHCILMRAQVSGLSGVRDLALALCSRISHGKVDDDASRVLFGQLTAAISTAFAR